MAKRTVDGEESLLPEHEAMSARLAEMTAEFKSSRQLERKRVSFIPSGHINQRCCAKGAVQNLRVDVGKLDRMLNLTWSSRLPKGDSGESWRKSLA